MRLNTDTPVPENVTATVKSVSAVGEQYIDLVPPGRRVARRRCATVPRIDAQHTAIGQDIAGLLNQADDLVSSIGDSRLQDLLKETFKAFNGSGPELARLIQSSRLLVDEANANYGQTDAADRPGRTVPGRADPQRRRHQVAGRRAGPVHHAMSTKPIRSCATCWRPRRARPTRPTPRSPVSGRPSRCWPPTSPTSAGSASSTASRSSRRWSSSPR